MKCIICEGPVNFLDNYKFNLNSDKYYFGELKIYHCSNCDFAFSVRFFNLYSLPSIVTFSSFDFLAIILLLSYRGTIKFLSFKEGIKEFMIFIWFYTRNSFWLCLVTAVMNTEKHKFVMNRIQA